MDNRLRKYSQKEMDIENLQQNHQNFDNPCTILQKYFLQPVSQKNQDIDIQMDSKNSTQNFVQYGNELMVNQNDEESSFYRVAQDIKQNQKQNINIDSTSKKDVQIQKTQKCDIQVQAVDDLQQNIQEEEIKSEIRNSLIQLFLKDKQKYTQICEYFTSQLNFDQYISNISSLIKQFDEKLNQTSKLQHVQILNNEESTFLASHFSKQKVVFLFKGISQYKKLSVFLYNTKASLFSIKHNIQGQWYQIRDDIIRKIHKYIKNIDIFIQNQMKNTETKQNQIQQNNHHKFQQKSNNILLQKYQDQKNNHCNKNTYQEQIYRIKKKIIHLRQKQFQEIKRILIHTNQIVKINQNKFKMNVQIIEEWIIKVNRKSTLTIDQVNNKNKIKLLLKYYHNYQIQGRILIEKFLSSILNPFSQSLQKVRNEIDKILSTLKKSKFSIQRQNKKIEQKMRKNQSNLNKKAFQIYNLAKKKQNLVNKKIIEENQHFIVQEKYNQNHQQKKQIIKKKQINKQKQIVVISDSEQENQGKVIQSVFNGNNNNNEQINKL